MKRERGYCMLTKKMTNSSKEVDGSGGFSRFLGSVNGE